MVSAASLAPLLPPAPVSTSSSHLSRGYASSSHYSTVGGGVCSMTHDANIRLESDPPGQTPGQVGDGFGRAENRKLGVLELQPAGRCHSSRGTHTPRARVYPPRSPRPSSSPRHALVPSFVSRLLVTRAPFITARDKQPAKPRQRTETIPG